MSHNLPVKQHKLDNVPHDNEGFGHIGRPGELGRGLMALSQQELQLLLDFVHDVLGSIRVVKEVFSHRDEFVGDFFLVKKRCCPDLRYTISAIHQLCEEAPTTCADSLLRTRKDANIVQYFPIHQQQIASHILAQIL